MLKRKTLIVALVLALLLGATAASAEVTNRDMQLIGGFVVSNSTDSFFFAPMQEGMTKHWGLFALSTAANGPIVEIQDGYPARLVHADEQKVYFFGYTDDAREVHGLYSVEISSGNSEELKTNISAAFVGETAEEILYVSADDLFTICSFNLSSKEDKKIKDMSASSKKIYDAGVYGGDLYFLTRADNNSEDGYKYNASSGKATNLDKPSPQLVNGYLYEGYRIYAGDAAGSQIYSIKIDGKNGTRLGQNYEMALNNPRYGGYMYAYDGENNELIGFSLENGAETKIKLEGSAIRTFFLGGSKDELLLLANGAVYAVTPDLASQSRLFDFDLSTGGQVWSQVVPAKNAVLIMGYGGETFTNASNLMPTGVYAYDRSSGELLFSYPAWDSAAAAAGEGEGESVGVTKPAELGNVPEDEQEEGETYFQFSTGDEESSDSTGGDTTGGDTTGGESTGETDANDILSAGDQESAG